MRRWNGWGEEGITYPVHEPAVRFLLERVGPSTPPAPMGLEDLLARVGEGRVETFPCSTSDPFQRLVHSFGQSFPDWLKFRMGLEFRTPDLVAFPGEEGEVLEIVDAARRERVVLIPYGGGTSVVGHLEVLDYERPVVSVDLSRMKGLLELDERSGVALLEAGATGPQVEMALGERGYTLGHFPQSFQFSTLGGWVATRSSGQFSLKYGKIERLFLGGRLVSPEGLYQVHPHPGAATGLDMKDVILGSEGRMGIITRCLMKVSRVPEKEVVEGALLPDDARGMEAVRLLAQAGVPLTMLRLSLSRETECMLALTAHKWWFGLLERYLEWRKLPSTRALLLFAASGSARDVELALSRVRRVVKGLGGILLGSLPGKRWKRDRFLLPYLRNTLWEMGYGVDTLETAALWEMVPELVTRIEKALEGAYAFSHLSHVYPTGSSIYTTFIFPLSRDPLENLERWRTLKRQASQAIVEGGGVISHHHGVGLDHKPYLEREKGELGLKVMRGVIKEFDPYGIMNPGKLVE